MHSDYYDGGRQMAARRIEGIYSRFLRSLTTIPGDMTGHEARAIREGMRLSRRALAQELGTNESSIYRWEKRGDREVPRMFMRALRDVLRERRAGSLDPPAQPASAHVAQG
jgi:DNA-binding transcriptional regulator YiaG